MDYSFRWNWVGLQNYMNIVEDPWLPKIFSNTLFYVFTTLTLFNVGLALLVSLVTTHINEKVGAAFRALWLLPRITPSTVYALLWLWATREDPDSLFNWFLGLFGLPPVNWRLEHPWLIVILVNGFIGVSFGMIIFTAALKSIGNDVIWAAKVDGASTWQLIRYVELPLIKWPILFVLAYQTLSLFTSYEYILLTTGGGPGLYTTEVWALYVYDLAFRQYGGIVKFGYGAALAVFLVIMGVVVSVIYLKVFRFRELMIEPKIEVE
ncbi:MAG: sugar ABC transporter permease [Thermoprotei archaeon]|nr:MAG: sugar ABC transporter permease [Thermoprotei archaeon]